jgi:predicted O-methyltransferase YrrM
MNEAIAKIESIDGWLSRNEAATLYELASKSTGPIAEIGSWQGRSTAALALGSMAGNRQPVYAIDSFIGIENQDRPTCFGTKPVTGSSSAELLRSNLDSVGINGLVRIIPKASEEAASEIPQCGLVFIDGAHDYESVRKDLETYAPKVKLGGFIVLHDCHDADPGVAIAADEILTPAAGWRCRWRADTAVVFERRNAVRHKVLLGFPGGSMCYGAHKGLATATLGAHDVYEEQSGMGWDDMNRLWCWALNQAAKGKFTHFAMLHSDIQPSPGWIDLLIDEMEERDADLISAVAALKDENGLTSCGVGDASDPFNPFRRFTMSELMEMPETFSIEDTPHPDKYLLHNTGCWVADLRKKLWRTVDKNACLVADFSFPIRGRLLANGEIIHERESEDWHFSRMIAGLGAKTLATRRVSTIHFGQKGFRNDYAWGRMQHDEATRAKWDK